MMAAAQLTTERDAMLLQLERILASEGFCGAERQRRFLRFIVEKTLAGESHEIKEYTIALDVYDRSASYNPRVDAIVRVEATRLRTKLRQYYETTGREDPVTIELPKGTYVPVMVLRRQAPAVSRKRTRLWWVAASAVLIIASIAWFPAGAPRATLAVLPFTVASDAESGRFTEGLGQELVSILSKTPGMSVASAAASVHPRGRFQLKGSVRRDNRRLRITAELADDASGFNLWSETYDRDLKNDLD